MHIFKYVKHVLKDVPSHILAHWVITIFAILVTFFLTYLGFRPHALAYEDQAARLTQDVSDQKSEINRLNGVIDQLSSSNEQLRADSGYLIHCTNELISMVQGQHTEIRNLTYSNDLLGIQLENLRNLYSSGLKLGQQVSENLGNYESYSNHLQLIANVPAYTASDQSSLTELSARLMQVKQDIQSHSATSHSNVVEAAKAALEVKAVVNVLLSSKAAIDAIYQETLKAPVSSQETQGVIEKVAMKLGLDVTEIQRLREDNARYAEIIQNIKNIVEKERANMVEANIFLQNADWFYRSASIGDEVDGTDLQVIDEALRALKILEQTHDQIIIEAAPATPASGGG